jgi:hypothetical protein
MKENSISCSVNSMNELAQKSKVCMYIYKIQDFYFVWILCRNVLYFWTKIMYNLQIELQNLPYKIIEMKCKYHTCQQYILVIYLINQLLKTNIVYYLYHNVDLVLPVMPSSHSVQRNNMIYPWNQKGFHISYGYSLWQHLSIGTKIFNLLTLKSDVFF